jgi:hypothetical protein
VDPGSGEPVSPRDAAKSYGNDVACILRETASINDKELRAKEHLAALLITKFHKRYMFPPLTITKISTTIW